MRRVTLFTTAVVFAGVCAAWSTGQDTLEARPAALLLRNGEVLEGRISFEGDYCAVILTRGELRIRQQQVVAVEPSVEALYLGHISPKAPAGTEGHVHRADWCLKHDLLDYAASEITLAQRQAPTSQRVMALAERLKVARRPRKVEASPLKVRRVPPVAQLPKLNEAIDPRSVEAFTVAVQPLLLNRCANAACHGRTSVSKFRLRRGFEGRPIPRTLTLANLASTIAQVDRANPAASRLLTTPIRPHGKAKQAVFLQHHRKQYDLLARWVEQLGEEKRGSAAGVAAKKTGAVAKKKGDEPSPKPMGINTEIDTLARPLSGVLKKTPVSTVERRVGSGKPSPVKSTRDPFDPEEFNRRFFPNRPKPN